MQLAFAVSDIKDVGFGRCCELVWVWTVAGGADSSVSIRQVDEGCFEDSAIPKPLYCYTLLVREGVV